MWDRSVGDDALLSLARVIPPQLRDSGSSSMVYGFSAGVYGML